MIKFRKPKEILNDFKSLRKLEIALIVYVAVVGVAVYHIESFSKFWSAFTYVNLVLLALVIHAYHSLVNKK